ncbi:uncharacterized protein LOC107766936 isoform X3 [Nicotiana tabacum]|uniref:Uncharacterized protein LOC107766936 isoform X3 n=2 Tax=Nicotiana TaxID=4085 RepID=A0A1S3XMX8_TOBAC|nr:PREDICTED: uncharacterized protein LOC104213966 isoform X3 [Nicotiana sylvestris]XP_016441330.1 PREDICTED: uncharacterized protein LOC107766936 isoform X4 [Nicotiana tabacum]
MSSISLELYAHPWHFNIAWGVLPWIARKSSMSGLENVGVAKEQDLSVTIVSEGRRPSVNAYLAKELNMSMTPMPMQSMSMYHGHQYVSQATEGLQGQGNSGTQTQVGSSSSQPQGSASTASQGGDFLSTKEQYDQIMQILNNTPSSYSSKCSRISSVAR